MWNELFIIYYLLKQIFYTIKEIKSTLPLNKIITILIFLLWMLTLFFFLLGAVFGAAKSYRENKGILWNETNRPNRIKMAIFANIFLLPSWVILTVYPYI